MRADGEAIKNHYGQHRKGDSGDAKLHVAQRNTGWCGVVSSGGLRPPISVDKVRDRRLDQPLPVDPLRFRGGSGEWWGCSFRHVNIFYHLMMAIASFGILIYCVI